MYKSRKLSPEERKKQVDERIRRGYPAHAPPHPIRNAKYYLLTAACYEHQRYMSALSRRLQVLEQWKEEGSSRGLDIEAWVILPNHYHLLVQVDDFDQVGVVARLAHGRTSRQWNREDNRPGRKVWYRYTDRAIRSERHYYTTLNYIHYNPVKHRLVSSPYDWEPSSLGWYLEHRGRDWLRDLWARYPLKSYGEG